MKKSNLMVLEVQSTKIVWFVEPVTDPLKIFDVVPDGTDIVLANPAKPFASAEEAELWDIVSQKLKREKNVILVFTTGEYRVKDVHMRGSLANPMSHYVLHTPDGSVGFFQGEPSDSFIKEYAPVDVVVGKGAAIAGVQLDLEPFYVVLNEVTDEYRTKSGISEVKEVDHVNIKKISQEDRDSVINMSVCAIN